MLRCKTKQKWIETIIFASSITQKHHSILLLPVQVVQDFLPTVYAIGPINSHSFHRVVDGSWWVKVFSKWPRWHLAGETVSAVLAVYPCEDTQTPRLVECQQTNISPGINRIHIDIQWCTIMKIQTQQAPPRVRPTHSGTTTTTTTTTTTIMYVVFLQQRQQHLRSTVPPSWHTSSFIRLPLPLKNSTPPRLWTWWQLQESSRFFGKGSFGKSTGIGPIGIGIGIVIGIGSKPYVFWVNDSNWCRNSGTVKYLYPTLIAI